MAGTDEIIGELLDVAARRLAAYGYLLTGSQHAGEELVQAAIVKVFVRRRKVAGVQAAEGYVRATMRSVHIDGLRRERLWRRVAPGQLAGREPVDDHAARIATRDAMQRALGSLSAQERTAVVLRYFDDLTVAQTADYMGLALGTVKRYVSNALHKLAVEIGDHDFDVERVTVEQGRE